MSFRYAVYIAFCPLHSVLEVFKRPRLYKASFWDFFCTTAGGESLLSRHHDSVNISFELSLEHLHSNQYFVAKMEPPHCPSIFLQYMHVLFLDAQISTTTATPCKNRRRQRLVACGLYSHITPHLLCVNLSEEKVELGRISTNITKRRRYNRKRNTGDL